MSDKNDGGSVYPVYLYDFQPTTGNQVIRDFDPGMSLRDYFAAHALAVLRLGDANHARGMAERAYELADAMLKAREESPNDED